MSSPVSVVAKHRGTSPSYLVQSGMIFSFQTHKQIKTGIFHFEQSKILKFLIFRVRYHLMRSANF